jgi:hypothetical protein
MAPPDQALVVRRPPSLQLAAHDPSFESGEPGEHRYSQRFARRRIGCVDLSSTNVFHSTIVQLDGDRPRWPPARCAAISLLTETSSHWSTWLSSAYASNPPAIDSSCGIALLIAARTKAPLREVSSRCD